MPKEAGDTVYGGSTEINFPNGGTDVPAGAAVNFDGSVVAEADGDAGDELTGIVGSDPHNPDSERVVIDGVVIAQVASGTGAGVDVDVGNATNSTVGVLEASAGGPAHTLCAEGGTFKGYSLDAGLAAVKVE